VPNVLKSRSLNLFEHSGPVQGCTGTASPLLLRIIVAIRLTGYDTLRTSVTALDFHRF